MALADSSKLHHAPFQAWARLPGTWTLITDFSATAEHHKDFRTTGVKILRAKYVRTREPARAAVSGRSLGLC